MKSGFLKLSIAIAAMVVSASASASSGQVTFTGEKVLVNEGSSLANTNFIQVTVDYDAQLVNIFAQRPMPECPANMACIQMMPAPYRITLPIQRIAEDSCGIKKVIASVDQRPVDGVLTKVTLEDASSTSCMFFRAPDQKFQMTEKYFNRLNGKEVTLKAKLMLIHLTLD